MKNKAKELDVDFIGGQGSLTKEEELQISAFISARKSLKTKQQNRKAETAAQKKVYNSQNIINHLLIK